VYSAVSAGAPVSVQSPNSRAAWGGHNGSPAISTACLREGWGGGGTNESRNGCYGTVSGGGGRHKG